MANRSAGEPIQRIAPSRDKAMEDQAYNPLHYAYLLWVDYLRASTEADKQQLLVEAASTLTVYGACGREGEEIVALVAQAINRRGRVYGLIQGSMRCYVEAVVEDGRHKFSILA
jgi:hypothetical protein